MASVSGAASSSSVQSLPKENRHDQRAHGKATPAMKGQPGVTPANGHANQFFNNRPPSVPKACPSTPKFATAGRAALRRQNSADTGNKAPASASRPVNRRILESPTTGVKKQKPQSPTRPIPFSLKTAERATVRTKSESETGHHDDLAKCFKALPLPSDAPALLPPKKVRPATTVQPFHFSTDRIDAAMKEKRRKMEKEMEERRRKVEFHAGVMPDFSRPVFCPVLAEKRHTEPENFQLSTDRRAEERRLFEERMKRKEEEQQAILQQRELERQRLEEEEIRRMRAAAVHRAQPVRHFKPLEIKHDPGNVTVPHTPQFHVDRRRMDRPPSRNGMGAPSWDMD